MTSDNQQKQKTFLKMREEYDLSIEVVILMVFGVFMLLFGFLLFKINTGALPYTPDSTYGLFLVIVSFQIITLGKTPFGDLRRSWALIIVGICTAILGMAACFVPGYLSELVRVLVGLILFVGGIALLVQLFVSKEKAKIWIKIPGILQQLTIACGLVYAITVILGLITLFPGITTDLQTALILIIYGISFLYLSFCIHNVSRVYPEEPDDLALSKLNSGNNKSKGLFGFFQETSLNLAPAILLLLGVLLVLLGVLLFPVNLGLIPFSPDGQLGLLLVIIAVQMMALGSTPVGQYKRSWLLIIIGIVFAALGIVSCIVPGLLTDVVKILLGVLNIVGGVLLLIKQFLPKLYEIRNPSEIVTVLPIEKRLSFTQTLLNFVAIAFGLATLLPYLIPGLVMAGVLVINGALLFILAFLLQKIIMIEIKEGQPAENPHDEKILSQ